ncbi:argininosuccinate synthase domain-containing protein [Campylobacter ureolyticus]|uniref:argininosuccinate synthase domain-containing protein n=1 Tax=Campylobacter ureolyticus TaxID=827 RepID=UPI0022B44689|nr:argininosuccinate synthase domain-containing protein [Campylobacter ureolyticus]MCZ6104989.1 argininosuccinate synthase [Campylobacter ureolyticus]MCZ6133646.1 argininosuccinate synthase [Campylobacter ureolyticus]MCZ6157979.1 argininosuccinate synthase [Campylobacter ureolyticus]
MKALALFSGGLDSMLAIKLITLQGIKVTAIYMDIGFGGKEDKSELLKKRANMAGADFKIVDIRNKYLQNVLLNPKYGYGKHFNPCIDCHAYMFKTALSMLKSQEASFLITGEVLGQRPMSQRKEALNQVLSLSGDENLLILRPLCAKLLKPTTPEINGWVDREKLLSISGRGRHIQLNLAKEFGFDDFESPAGGCLLTLDNYSKKLTDALNHEGLDTPKDSEILKFGRHLRLKGGAKLIIGKDENDNLKLKNIQNDKFVEINLPSGVVGAYVLISKNACLDDKILAAKFALTYSKADISKNYKMIVGGDEFSVKAFENKDKAKEFFVG